MFNKNSENMVLKTKIMYNYYVTLNLRNHILIKNFLTIKIKCVYFHYIPIFIFCSLRTENRTNLYGYSY